MTQVILDASALLAMLRREPGGSMVDDNLEQALISSVNWAEVAGHFARRGVSRAQIDAVLDPLPVVVVSASAAHARDAAALLPATRAAGLSLGDRFCLALARAEGRRVMTADRAWASLEIADIEVVLIR